MQQFYKLVSPQMRATGGVGGAGQQYELELGDWRFTYTCNPAIKVRVNQCYFFTSPT